MTTKTQRYDHPAYTVPVFFSGNVTTGPNGVSEKFVAYTAMKLKALTMSPTVATTAAGSTPLLYVKSGTGVSSSTTTTTLAALTSATFAAQQYALAAALTLAQGDQFWVTHGTDATAQYSFAIEGLVIPGSNITA